MGEPAGAASDPTDGADSTGGPARSGSYALVWTLSGCLVGAVIILVLAIQLFSEIRGRPAFPMPTEAQMGRYEATCAPVLAWVEAERAAQGRYPPELRADLQAVLDGIGPPSRYAVAKDGTRFEIQIGEYSHDNWTYYFDSDGSGWHLGH